MVRLRVCRPHLAITGLLFIASPAMAVTGGVAPIGAHVEAGLGSTSVRPLEKQSAPGATVGAGLSAPLRGALRIGLEFAASVGGDPPGVSHIPEASRPGDRTLTTFLLGIEARSSYRDDGPFAFLGAGVGHSTLSNARGVFTPPYDQWLVPSRSLTALAVGAGIGYRFAGGPGPLGFSLALRTQLMPRSGQIAASATTATPGLAY